MAASVVQLIAAGENTTNNTTLPLTVLAQPTPGNVVIIAARNGNAANRLISTSDGANTWWTRLDNSQRDLSASAVAASWVDAMAVKPLGATITLTWSGASNLKVGYAWEVAGLDPHRWFGGVSVPGTYVLGGTARASNAIVCTFAGDAIFSAWLWDSTVETSLTPSGGWTAGPASTGAGYFAGTNNSAEMVYQVTTTTGSKTPAATGGSSPFALSQGAAIYRVPRAGIILPGLPLKPRPFKPGGDGLRGAR